MLVYATCSVFKEENQDIVSAFLENHPEFSLEPFNNPINNEYTKGMLQLWPQEHDSDGMFIAKLRRTK